MSPNKDIERPNGKHDDDMYVPDGNPDNPYKEVEHIPIVDGIPTHSNEGDDSCFGILMDMRKTVIAMNAISIVTSIVGVGPSFAAILVELATDLLGLNYPGPNASLNLIVLVLYAWMTLACYVAGAYGALTGTLWMVVVATVYYLVALVASCLLFFFFQADLVGIILAALYLVPHIALLRDLQRGISMDREHNREEREYRGF